MEDPEIKAMAAVNSALGAIEDPEVRKRVLRWANEKFGFQSEHIGPGAKVSRAVAPALEEIDGEIPGIARLDETGGFRLTVRDLKAKSANDAAIRLVHVALRAYERLAGQKGASSKNVLVPLLKGWRVYDGNTRASLARHKGIIRTGDELQLDFHAQAEADQFISEILDDEIEGEWKPGTRAKRRAASAGKKP